MVEDESTTKDSWNITKKRIIFFTFQGVAAGSMFSMWGQIQYFAATVLLIPQTIITIIYLVYSIIDGLNDPIIGYLSDRSTKFTSRFGKRFPWILIGSVIGPILLVLCFLPITTAIILAAIWLSLIMVIYESFLTLFEVNHSSLLPDMFRDPADRRKVAGLGGVIGGIVTIVNSITIPILISLSGQLSASIVIIIIAYVFLVPYLLFGAREPHEMKQLRLSLDADKKSFSSVKEVVIRIFKDRNWMAIVLVNFCWAIAGACTLYGLNFFVIHNLGLDIATTSLPLLMLILGGLILAPAWVYVAKKIGVRNAYLAALIFVILGNLFFIFVTDLIGVIFVFAFASIGYSATYGAVFRLLFAEGLDNAAISSGKREEGSYNGILRVFSAFSYFLQTLIFAIVGSFTGYNPAIGVSNTPFAKFGLNLQMSLIPMIINIIGLIIFLAMYKITKEEAEGMKTKLREMSL